MALTGYRCTACGQVFVLPALYCPECGSSKQQTISLSGRGTILSGTTIHVGPTRYESEVPYTVVLVALEEGGRVMGRLTPTQNTMVGTRLILSYVDDDQGPVFSLADDSGQQGYTP